MGARPLVGRVLYVRIPRDLFAAVEEQAGVYGVSLTAFVSHGLDAYMREHFEWEGSEALRLPG